MTSVMGPPRFGPGDVVREWAEPPAGSCVKRNQFCITKLAKASVGRVAGRVKENRRSCSAQVSSAGSRSPARILDHRPLCRKRGHGRRSGGSAFGRCGAAHTGLRWSHRPNATARPTDGPAAGAAIARGSRPVGSRARVSRDARIRVALGRSGSRKPDRPKPRRPKPRRPAGVALL